MTSEQKQKLLNAKVAAALHNGSGKVSGCGQIEDVSLRAGVLHKAVPGMHFKRHEKPAEQLRIG